MKRIHRKRTRITNKYALRCNMCDHRWSVVLIDATNQDMVQAIHDNKYCPQCSGIEVLYVGEAERADTVVA